MSILLIRCPFKPFAGAFTGLASECEDLACAQRFEWCLVNDAEASSASTSMALTQSGIGSIESMPYADEVLALLPTLDVRLIEAKVPLANPKKLQAMLPALLEDYLLSNTATLHIDVLAPIPDSPAMNRSMVAIDRAWFTWITSQLACLLSSRVRLMPDCLLLALPGDTIDNTSSPVLMSVCEGDATVYCQRTGVQTGIAWAEYPACKQESDGNTIQGHNSGTTTVLPSCLGSTAAVAFSWAWAAPSAIAFLEASADSRSPHYALNLLPRQFKSGAGVRIPSNASADHANATALAWVDPITWQPALRWLGLGMAVIALGLIAQLAWLTMANWRWDQQMELLAMPSLTPANINTLNSTASGNRGINKHVVLTVFMDQTIKAERSQGAITEADFAPLAAKLQKLSRTLNAQSLQQINYNANAIDFEFKPGTADYSSKDGVLRVITSARNLGFSVKHLGSNRYRLESFAGLGFEP